MLCISPNTFASAERNGLRVNLQFFSGTMEAESWICPQLSGGNSYIHVTELNSLSFQRLRLFIKLQRDSSSNHKIEDCYMEALSEEQCDYIAPCFHITPTLTDTEISTLLR